jgi:predicted HTH domain antitoxin
MQITIDFPDNLSLTESDLRREAAIMLFEQNHISPGRASKSLTTQYWEPFSQDAFGCN